jgi:hypothetical protein
MEFTSPADDPNGVLGARVDQLSKLLEVTPERVTELCEELMPGTELPRGFVPDALVRALLRDYVPRRPLDDAIPLIVSAFESARDARKDDWRVMALSVLKNRMRQLSGGTFDEADFGMPNLHYFACQFPQLLSLAPASQHQMVRFIVDLPGEVSKTPPERQNVQSSQPERSHVRADIWNATMDYSSPEEYVWLVDAGRAEQGRPSESALHFPTVSRFELGRWRQSFITSLQDDTDPTELERLTNWDTRGGASPMLPLRFRALWNGFLRDRVVERASEFFVLNNIEIPSDVVQSTSPQRKTPPTNSVASFRRRLHDLIDELTDDELALVALPASAVLRTSQGPR